MGAKSSFYFDHDYNARNDQKILELRSEFGWHGYGLYFAILENLCEANGYLSRESIGGLSLGLTVEKKKLTIIIDFCIKIGLFDENELGFFSKRIIQHLDYREQLRESGRKGGRGNKKPPFSHPLATLNPPLTDAKASLKPPRKQDRIEEDRIEEENKKLKEKNKFSFDFLQFDPYKKQFMIWFDFKQQSDKPYTTQASVEAEFKQLKIYSQHNVNNSEQVVNYSITRNYTNLFAIDIKPGPVPKHHMPR